MKKKVLLTFLVLLYFQAEANQNTADIKAEDIQDLVLCMEQDVCTEPVSINPHISNKRSGFVLRHKDEKHSYVFVLTNHRTMMVMIETEKGDYLLDDLFLNGTVISGFFIPKDGSKTIQYPEKIVNEKGEKDVSLKDRLFFQTPYNEAMSIAISRFLDKMAIHRKQLKLRNYT